MEINITGGSFEGKEGSRAIVLDSGIPLNLRISGTKFATETGIEVRTPFPTTTELNRLKHLIEALHMTRERIEDLAMEVANLQPAERDKALRESKLIKNLSLTADVTSLISFVSSFSGSEGFRNLLNLLFK
jgi:hypothetical protein